MEQILTFAKEATPTAITAILAVIIFYLVRNGGIISKLRGTQISDKDKVDNKEITDKIDLRVINEKLDKIATNHLHELPQIAETIKRMEVEQISQGNRLTKVETTVTLILDKKI